ncbi:MAG: hypothetical protein A2Z28_07145 [Chloroflexi bacterium RBG_16_51_9]|nr:MAG: hypothetical protein A2Z28_07145 [Chloroflexi bacterium RBG_16_51_9]
MKRTRLLILVLFLLLAMFSSACFPSGTPSEPVKPGESVQPVQPVTQVQPVTPVVVNQLTILSSSAKPDFPAQLTFSLKAASDSNIADVRLHYTVDREGFANVTSEVYLDFAPGNTIDVQWPWDMRKTGGLPTGATVKYWWTVKDVNGNIVETAPSRISFDDTRYAWQSITEDKTTIYWYKGDLSFAREIMSATQEALTRLSGSTGAYLKKPVKIYVYASRDLLGAMIFPQEWTGGVAFTEFGTIIIGIDSGNLDWGKRAITHELTHLVVHQMTFNPYGDLPTWLDEGLAVYNEGELEANFVNTLKAALDNNGLISARSLSSPFSANTNEALLSYAESYSLVEFLVKTYGQSKMLELLTTFSQGSTYNNALGKAYGFDVDGLNTLWRDYVIERYKPAGKTATLPSPLMRAAGEIAAVLRLASLNGVSR